MNGFIHRDVKAANLLLDDDGTVLLGDLGVAASLSDEEPIPVSGLKMSFDAGAGNDHARNVVAPSAKKLGKRKSFVGTVSDTIFDAHSTELLLTISLMSLSRLSRSSHSPLICRMLANRN